jgi:tRNA threonylcarbamoyladenosine biosynthesis protein TsaE
VVGLDGPLGAGKTTLVRALAGALGADTRLVASPTYVIMHEYPIRNRATLVHIDAYRLAGDLDDLGLDRVGEGSITFIEWAQRLADAMPPGSARITIDIVDEHRRDLLVDLPDAWRSRPALETLSSDVIRCPKTDLAVSPADPHFPFATERARMADLHGWITERYQIQRPIAPDDDPDSLAAPPPPP